MDAEPLAELTVSDLPRAANWYDRFFGDVEILDPNDTERVRTLGERRYIEAATQE